MLLTTLSKIIKLFNSASNDATRPHLNGIYLKVLSDDLIQIEACDGQIYAFKSFCDPGLYEALKEADLEAFIPLSCLNILKALFKDNKSLGHNSDFLLNTTLDISGMGQVLIKSINGLTHILKADPKLIRPDIVKALKVYQKDASNIYKDPDNLKIGFNFKNLKNLINSLKDKDLVRDDDNIIFTIKGPLDPIILSKSLALGPQGLLMPLRLDQLNQLKKS